MLVLNCRSGGGPGGGPRKCVPVSVASITPHRVFNKDESGSSLNWHVELEIQTLLVPSDHQVRLLGAVLKLYTMSLN